MNAICKFFGCTPEQLKAQHARNADVLGKMAAKAEATGKPVNHYSAAQLRKMESDARARGL